MPEILIDVTRLLYRLATGVIPTGIDRVGLEYTRHYAESARAVLSVGPFAAAATRADSRRLFRRMLDGAGGLRPLAAEIIAKCYGWYWLMPGTGGRILFNTSYLWLENSHYAMQLRLFGARPLYFVHDLIPISHPEYFLPGQRRKHVERMRVMLTTGCGIIVNSRHTEAAVLAHAAQMGLKAPPMVVAPLAAAVRTAGAAGPRPLAQPYFVILSTIEPRKNHLLLLHLWRQLVERHGAAAVPRLYVVGQRGWEYENVFDLLERCEALNGVVVHLSRCSDAELANLLAHAQALLMPSFAEGFGLPVAEALAAGVPVIASDLPAIREIAADIPEYADPIDGRRWTELVLDYARPDSPLRRAQCARMAGFHALTWEQHFDVVDRFVASLQ